ncbi:hypothetical protein TCON_0920 [Astathelohania contejeani]|uniref:DRBM domain-containing protein n=1 Tax=Astathelohania contejeani TaxID=164912 RepID=A0ABQ7I0D8_9MICR|nr:hypothetical protein TCON_0920 [Thelohania contejeani]
MNGNQTTLGDEEDEFVLFLPYENKKLLRLCSIYYPQFSDPVIEILECEGIFEPKIKVLDLEIRLNKKFKYVEDLKTHCNDIINEIIEDRIKYDLSYICGHVVEFKGKKEMLNIKTVEPVINKKIDYIESDIRSKPTENANEMKEKWKTQTENKNITSDRMKIIEEKDKWLTPEEKTIKDKFIEKENMVEEEDQWRKLSDINYLDEINKYCISLNIPFPEYIIEKQNEVYLCSAEFRGLTFTSKYFKTKEGAKEDACRLIFNSLKSEVNPEWKYESSRKRHMKHSYWQ